MIIWLASYPRSGNTLASQIFGSVFQYPCYEKYNNFDRYIRPQVGDAGHRHVGLVKFQGSWENFIDQARRSKRQFIIKTHDAPEDESPCIYVIRDGLHAMESYYAYYHKVTKAECLWEDLIFGTVFPYLNWADHLDLWQPLRRPRTFLLRYESLIKDELDCLDDLSAFTGLELKAGWKNNFSEHQRRDPDFFRQGRAQRSELLPSHAESLFHLIQGDWMERMGYGTEQKSSDHSARVLLRERIREMRHAIRDKSELLRSLGAELSSMVATQTDMI